MADAPEQLTLSRHRDLRGRERRPRVRWALLTLLGVFLLAGLLNVFGQRPQTDVAENDVARLEVYSPKRLRSGLYYESRFDIDARREIESATLVLAAAAREQGLASLDSVRWAVLETSGSISFIPAER